MHPGDPPADEPPIRTAPKPLQGVQSGYIRGTYTLTRASAHQPTARMHSIFTPLNPHMPSQPAIMPFGDPPTGEPPIGAPLGPLQAGRKSSDGARRWSLWAVRVLLSWF